MATFLVLVLAACSSTGQKTIQNETQVTLEERLNKGVTTKEEVKATFGDPATVTFPSAGSEQWVYELQSDKLNAAGWTILGAFVSPGSTKTKQLTILFDGRGVVANYALTESTSALRPGLLGGPLVR